MSNWLQKRLAVWMGVSLLLALIGFRVVAQPRSGQLNPPKSAAEAARLFGRLLQMAPEEYSPVADSDDYYLAQRLISRADWQKLGIEGLNILLQDLEKKQRIEFESSAEQQENGRTIIDIAPKTTPASAPVVLLTEAGGYRVDLIATYGKRLQLETGALEKAIYAKTKVALDGLPDKDTPFLQKDICQSNLRQLTLALLQYNQDYDEYMPPAKQWSDVLQPYKSREAVFHCPSLSKDKRNGYAFNSKQAFKSYYVWSASRKTPVFYETTLLKRNAYGMGENLAFRHQGGANYAFTDGHVKWFPKTQIPSFKLKP